MGKLLYGEERLTPEAGFRFLAGEPFRGVVLTGTKSVVHLRENWEAFQTVMGSGDASSRL